MGLARHDGEFEAAGEASVDARELLNALRRPAAAPLGNRSEAVANCLAGGEGWRDAATRLGGAFATIANGTGLTDGKE
ncbi:MAG: hypothetical protein ABIR87_05960 [Sphingomicrobium sp.]